MKDTIRTAAVALEEHLTFGRRPWRLLRVWILESIVIVFSEVGVITLLHPWIDSHLGDRSLVELYLLVTLVSLALLVGAVRKMGRLTFAPWSRTPRHLAASTLGYLTLGGLAVVVVFVLPAPSLEPNLGHGVTLEELVLGAMVTTGLATLLALGFYAQFDATGFPNQKEIDDAVGEWLRALDWTEMPEGSWDKDERYREFYERSEHLAGILDHAVTTEGRQLRDDFEEWLSWFRTRNRLSQEAVISDTVENVRLERQQERLNDIRDRFERIKNE